MRIIPTSFKYQSFVWDFAVDSGAMGVYPIAIFIPKNSVVTSAYARCINAVTEGTPTDIRVQEPLQTRIFLDLPATSFTAGTAVQSFLSAYILWSVNYQIQLELELTGILTGGKFIFTIEYMEMPE